MEAALVQQQQDKRSDNVVTLPVKTIRVAKNENPQDHNTINLEFCVYVLEEVYPDPDAYSKGTNAGQKPSVVFAGSMQGDVPMITPRQSRPRSTRTAAFYDPEVRLSRPIAPSEASPPPDNAQSGTEDAPNLGEGSSDSQLIQRPDRLRVDVPKPTVSLPEPVRPEIGFPTYELLDNKWIYVLDGKTLIIEVNAFDSEHWYVYDKPNLKADPNRNTNITTKGYIPNLKRKHEYGFFLSPIRLTQDAFDRLNNPKQGEELAVTSCTFDNQPRFPFVILRDPFRWARNAHENWYQRALDEYVKFAQGDEGLDGSRAWVRKLKWAQKPERNALYFIASIVTEWLAHDENGTVRDALKTDPPGPSQFINEYDNTAFSLLSGVDNAMQYVVQCVDSHGHRVVELVGNVSGKETANEDARGYVLGQWAAIFYRTANSKAGCEFLKTIIADDNRLPRKLVFTKAAEEAAKTAPKEGETEDFQIWRFGTLAHLAIVTEGLGTWVAQLKKSSVLAGQSPDQYFRRFVKSLPVKGMSATKRRVKVNVQKGRTWYHGLLNTDHTLKDQAARSAYEHFVAAANENYKAEVESLKLDGPRGWFDKDSHFGKRVKQLKVAAGGVFNIANLVIALKEVWEDSDKGATRAAAAAAVFELAETTMDTDFASERIGEELSETLSEWAGFFGGVSLAFEYGYRASEAWEKGYYGQAVGYDIAKFGGGTQAVGFAIRLASVEAGLLPEAESLVIFSAETGNFLLVAGSVILLAGVWVASYLTPNEVTPEVDACYFGKGIHRTTDDVRQQEARLKRVLANFSGRKDDFPPELPFPRQRIQVLQKDALNLQPATVPLESNGPGSGGESSNREVTTYLTVTPGWLPQGSIFEIFYQSSVGPGVSPPVRIKFDLGLSLIDPVPDCVTDVMPLGDAFIVGLQLGAGVFVDEVFISLDIGGGVRVPERGFLWVKDSGVDHKTVDKKDLLLSKRTVDGRLVDELVNEGEEE